MWGRRRGCQRARSGLSAALAEDPVHTQTRIAILWLMAAAVAAGGGGGARVSAQNGTALPLSSNQWNIFSVDVTVRATRVSA